MKPVLVYLSGPLSPCSGYSKQANRDAAVAVFSDLMRRGIPAFCPHLCVGVSEVEWVGYELWMCYAFAVIERCTHVLMLERWGESLGAVREHEHAVRVGARVVYSIDELEGGL